MATDGGEQNNRKQKPTYLDLAKACLQAETSLKTDIPNHSQVSSAKILGSRRSAVPLVPACKVGTTQNFYLTNHKKER